MHLSTALDRTYVPRHVLLFLCLHGARNCVLPAKRIAPWKAGVETAEVHLRKASYAVILGLGRINSLQLLAARTGGGAYPEVCRQGKCDSSYPCKKKRSAVPSTIETAF